jgi:extradiol dioxygenase family protein
MNFLAIIYSVLTNNIPYTVKHFPRFRDQPKERTTMMKPAKAALDIGVFVSDIAASLNFYQNLLGMEKEGESQMPIGMMHRLKFGDSVFKLIEPKGTPPQVHPA